MAAKEYYLGTQAAYELPGSHPSNPNPSQPQNPPQYQQPPAQPYPQPNGHNSAYADTPPPSYSAYLQRPPQQPHGYPPQQQYQRYPEKKNAQPMTAPYPQTPPAGYYYPQQPMPQPQQTAPQNTGYLGAPPKPCRSHSQPARVRFADQDSDCSTSLGSMSDSDDYSPPRHSSSRHHGRHHSHSTRDLDSARDREHDRDRDHRRHNSYDKAHEDKHKNRDTFLGAGAGTIIGDAIFPGLGTAAGLVLGGYGGRKYADTRSKSDYGGGERRERRSHGGSRRAGDDGWDEKTRTYRKGAAVRR